MLQLLLRDRKEEEIGGNLLLVEKRLDQLRSRRDVRFGRSQEGACRQGTQLKIILKSHKRWRWLEELPR